MKLPIQKIQGKEPMSPEEEVWPVRSLMEKYFPSDWFRPWSGFERGLYREMESWMPRVDISETDTEFNITADVPGVKPEDVKVEISGDSLIISGKSEEKKEEQGKAWHRMERSSGSFYREFMLPAGADADKIEASAKDGMLTVKLQKKPEAQSRSIEIKHE